MIEKSGRGRKKTVRKKACRRKTKNTEEENKYLLCGEEDEGLTAHFTLAVYIQFLVAADRQRQARTGRNPRTGDTLQIPARQVPTFTPGKAFQELVHPATARVHGATNGAARRQTTLW